MQKHKCVGEQLNEDCFWDNWVYIFICLPNDTEFMVCFLTVTISFAAEFLCRESHVVWCKQVNEKQDLKNVSGKMHKGLYIKIRYFLDCIF